MKTLKFLFAGAIAIAVLFACSDGEKIEPEPEPEVPDEPVVPEEPTEEDYAEAATISSDDTYFAFSEEEGYTVSFKTEGGQVVVDVDCGTDWDVENSASDVFTAECDYDNATLTISAEQNTVAEELTGTITLMTLPSKIEFATITVTQNAYGAVEIKVESNEWHVAAVGDNLSTTVSVEATDEWEVENTADWLTVEKGDAAVTITAKENEETEERTADITLTCTDGISTDSEIIRVTQDGHAYITVGDEELSVSADAGEATITVESNYEWESSCEADWVTLTKATDGTSLTISYTANETEEEREATITLTAGDGEANTAEAEISISQAYVNPNALILEYTISSGNTQIALPVYSSVNVTVDWGDGESQTTTTNNQTHTYADAGVYTVTIDGSAKQLRSASGTNTSNVITGAEYLTAVKQWGDLGLTSMEYGFRGCSGLASLPAGAAPFSNVTTLKYAFSQVGLTELPEGLLDNCSKVTDCTYCFTQSPSLAKIPNELFAHCTSTTTFASVLSNCPSLTELPEDIFKNCTAATTFSSAFRYDVSIEKIPAGLFTDCTAATKFDYVFSFTSDGLSDKTSALTEVGTGIFDKNDAATDFSYAFYGCANLKEIPAGLFKDKANVTTYSYTFRGCSSVTEIPSDLFGSQPAAKTFTYVFRDCTGLTDSGIPTGLLDGCTAATSCQGFFYACTGLTTLPVGLFDKCTSCTNFESVFRGCTGLTTLDPEFFEPLTFATDFAYIFDECSGITTIPDDLFTYNTAVTSYNYVFANCTGLTKIPGTLFDNASAVKTFNYAFNGCTNLETIEPGLFEKCSSLVTSYQYVFSDCTSLTTLPDPEKGEVLFGESPKATTCSSMFSGCSSLTEIPKGLLDGCTAATSFQAAFSGCSSLVTIPTSLFDYCTAVTNFKQTFYNCVNLEGESPYTDVDGVKIHLYERTSSNGFKNITASNYADCFTGCVKLTDYADILAAGWATE